jgi:hypothetical protein
MKMPCSATAAERIRDEQESANDITPYMQAALDNVITVVMGFGQWPQPRPWQTQQRKIEFVLRDWMAENVSTDRLMDFSVAIICGSSKLERMETIANFEGDIEEMMRDHLRDSEIVQEEAERIMDDERDGK